MDRDDGNKTQRLHICRSNYALTKIIVDNGFEDLRRRENPSSSEFTSYDGSTGTRFKTYRVIKIANSIKINHIMVSFTDHYNAISIERLSSKTKIGKDS